MAYIFLILFPLISTADSFSKWVFYDSKAAMYALDKCEREYALYFEDRILYGREDTEWKSCGTVLSMADKVNFSKYWGIKGAAYLKILGIKDESCTLYNMRVSEGVVGRDLIYNILIKTFYGDFDYCKEIKGEAR